MAQAKPAHLTTFVCVSQPQNGGRQEAKEGPDPKLTLTLNLFLNPKPNPPAPAQ